jgi:AbrB family looped-hinge helix DNA binding protein
LKGTYKLIDSKGRVYLPKELRDALELDCGDFVKLTEQEGKLCIQKVHLIEAGDQSPEAVETYVHAAAAAMPREKQVELAAMLLKKIKDSEEK